MDSIIFSDLPDIQREKLRFNQMVSIVIIPYWDELSPNKSIQEIVENVLNPETYPEVKPETIMKQPRVQEMLGKITTKLKEDGIDDELLEIVESHQQSIESRLHDLDNPRKIKLSATKTPQEVMNLLGHKITLKPEEPKPEEPVKPETTPTKVEHDLETMLTGELISLNKDVNKRFQWYNDIDFGHIRSIVEKKSLKKKIIKFETQTIDSYMNKYKKLYDLLSHHRYEIEMLSSTKERTYVVVFDEYKKQIDLIEKITLVDEMKMISSSWLPKEQLFSRRKRITPVIAGKAKSSADKSES